MVDLHDRFLMMVKLLFMHVRGEIGAGPNHSHFFLRKTNSAPPLLRNLSMPPPRQTPFRVLSESPLLPVSPRSVVGAWMAQVFGHAQNISRVILARCDYSDSGE